MVNSSDLDDAKKTSISESLKLVKLYFENEVKVNEIIKPWYKDLKDDVLEFNPFGISQVELNKQLSGITSSIAKLDALSASLSTSITDLKLREALDKSIQDEKVKLEERKIEINQKIDEFLDNSLYNPALSIIPDE